MEAVDLSGWNATINQIAKDLHSGKLKPAELNEELIQKTYTTIVAGAAIGYGAGWIKFNKENSATVQELKQNIYRFSGAKTYQQLAEMNSHLVDKNGKIRNFSDFKKEVFKTHKKYNKNYLQAEYQNAKRSAQASREWKDFEANKDLFPNLKYMTVGDEKVRDEHSAIHGVIKPVDDVFWDTNGVPNGFRCRCYLVPTNEKATTKKIAFTPDKGFAFNPGKVTKIFDENAHPYFAFPKQDENSIKKAFENFKLTAPYGKARYTAKNGAKVFVSPFTDTNTRELIGNYKVAIKIADTLKMNVKLRPHIDGTILLKKSNPEYLIDGKLADRKSPKGLNVKNTIIKANKQGSEIVVFDLHDNNSDFNAFLKAIKQRLKRPEHYKNIKEIILISKDRKVVKHYLRKDW